MQKPLQALIIEDCEDDAELVLLELRRGGFIPRSRRVTTAEEMLASLKSNSWEIILADYALPSFDAITALRLLRQSGLDLPFIVVSGAISEEVAVELMREGASDYIFKGNLRRLPAAVERELRESENRRARHRAEQVAYQLAAVVQSSFDPIVSTTLEGIVTSWNPAAERLYGWSEKEAVGKQISSFFVPTDRAAELDDQMNNVRKGKPIEQYETVRLHKGGYRFDVSMTVSPIRDQSGQLVGVSKIVRDISDRKRAEAALRQSEERYRILAESLPQLVWTTCADGSLEYSNSRWSSYTGLALGELREWNSQKLVHPDDLHLTQLRWRDALATGEPFNVEYRLLSAEGKYRWHMARGLPLRDAQGRINHWFGTCTDIHEQKQIEVALRESEERLKHIVANAPFPAAVYAEDGQLLMLSHIWAELTGYAECEMPTLQTWVIKAYGEHNASELRRMEELFAITGRHHAGEFRVITRSGAQLIWDFWATPLGCLPDGRRFVLCMAVDVTQRKHVEEALQLRDRAIRAATQGIIITDPNQPDNPIVYVSLGFEQMTGYSLVESVGSNCRFLQGRDTDPAVIARLREAVRAAEPCTVELLNYRKDGTPWWNELSISAVRDADGQLTHFVGVQTDVTQRRRLEEQFRQSQKMEAFGQLAGGIAHDFNNLLTIILGYSEVMLDLLPVDDRCREPLKEIKNAAERSASLTSQLLAFSRKQVIDPKVLDLNEAVCGTEKMLRRVLGEDIHLITALSPEIQCVKADPGQLEQILVNLAVNARDAMPEGGELLIQTEIVNLDESDAKLPAGIRAGLYVMLAVTDSGRGMTEEVRQKAFEPFFSTKGPGKGTGLGLSVVHGIVKQSDGHIDLWSEVGVGTSFKIYFPLVEVSAPRQSSLPADPKPLPLGTETILFVEDEGNVRLLGLRALQRCGYEVLVAGDPLEAIQISQSHDGVIDLLLTDVIMPNMNGRKLAEALQLDRPEMRVAFMSGYTDDTIVRQGVLNDEVTFLHKPFSLASIAEKVRECLDSASVMRLSPREPNSGLASAGIPAIL